jgi:hypothetical protein
MTPSEHWRLSRRSIRREHGPHLVHPPQAASDEVGEAASTNGSREAMPPAEKRPGPAAGAGTGSHGLQVRPGERGVRGYGPRVGESRGVRRGEFRGRHFGRCGWRGGRVYGFTSGCGWLRRRALDTGSRYWWRRYRECLH